MDSSLEIKNLSLSIGGLHILSEIDLSLKGQEIVALIGPNGAGKTSLLDCISGLYCPTSGRIILNGVDITRESPSKRVRLGLSRLFQISELFNEMSVVDNLLLGRHIHMQTNLFDIVFQTRTAKNEKLISDQEVERILETLNLEDRKNQLVGRLPHGIRRKVELGRCLLMNPSILLLDEPVSGMSSSEIEEMTEVVKIFQKDKGLLIILIEHHMGVVLDISKRIIVIHFGKVVADGTPLEIKNNPVVINAYLGNNQQ